MDRLAIACSVSLLLSCVGLVALVSPPLDAGGTLADAGGTPLDAGADCGSETRPCPTPCDAGCTTGLSCVNDVCVCSPSSCVGCCANNQCVSPALSNCGAGGGACMACNQLVADTCSAGGGCQCGAGAACGSGQRCVNGTCTCDATSCSTGCCQGATCQVGSPQACGAQGGACAPCDAARANACVDGACRCGTLPPCGAGQQCVSGAPLATTGVGFNDPQDRLVNPPAGFPASPSSWTFATWLRIAVDRNTYSAFFTIEQPVGHPFQSNELVTLPDGTTLVFFDPSGASATLGQLTVGTWYFAAISVGPGGALSTWLAPEGGNLNKVTGHAFVIDHIEISYVGSSNFTAVEYLNGSMALARLWNGVLSDAEILAEFHSATPRRTAGLIGDWRLTDAASAGVDSSGLGHNLGVNFGATHTTVTGPKVTGAASTCQ